MDNSLLVAAIQVTPKDCFLPDISPVQLIVSACKGEGRRGGEGRETKQLQGHNTNKKFNVQEMFQEDRHKSSRIL